MVVELGDDKLKLTFVNGLSGSNKEEYKKKKIKFLEHLIDNGNDELLVKYGMMIYNGEGTNANKEEGMNIIKTASEKGNKLPNIIYQQILKNQPNKIDKLEFIKNAADQSDVYSMRYYAEMLFRGIGIPGN